LGSWKQLSFGEVFIQVLSIDVMLPTVSSRCEKNIVLYKKRKTRYYPSCSTNKKKKATQNDFFFYLRTCTDNAFSTPFTGIIENDCCFFYI
jgi:hypothetical protein